MSELSKEELDAIERGAKIALDLPSKSADVRAEILLDLLASARKLGRVREWAHYPEWADDPQKCGCRRALQRILEENDHE